MIGILTEKPSAANNFSKALGGKRGKYNGEEYIIVSSRGHLYEFVDPENQVPESIAKQYKSWDVENLPWDEKDLLWKKKKKNDSGATKTLKEIKEVLSSCDEVVIATDVDPTGEGNLLAWEIINGLKIKNKNWSRMFFDDETPKSIQKSFVNRKKLNGMLDDADYVKADFRSKWDYLSMQFTRIATKYGDGRSVLRQGRLKSVMVSLVGDALKALLEYKKIPYYQNRFKDNNGVVYTNSEEPQFPNKDQVPNNYQSSSVVVDSQTTKYKSPPKLVDMATLSSILARKGIKAKTVLSTYQKMYDAQVVSYPRTEDKCITPEQFEELLPLVDKIAALVGVDSSVLKHRIPRTTHVKKGGTHGANRPGINVPNSLNELTKFGPGAPEIYILLAKNYLAMLCEDYEYESQKGHIEKYPKFVGVANVPKKMGYKIIFSDMDIQDEDNNEKGLGTTAEPFVFEGFPKKPPLPTMSWLMKSLEKYDVGTGATRTSIYADVTNENSRYPLMIEIKGKLSMTPFGNMSYLLLDGTHIGDLKTTEQLMQNMRDISKHIIDPSECLNEMQQLVRDDIKTMKRNSITKKNELDAFRTKGVHMSDNNCDFNCPVCGSPMREFDWGYACSKGKDDCGFTVSKTIAKKKLSKSQIKTLCENKKTDLIKGFVSSKGKSFDAYLEVEDGKTQFSFPERAQPKETDMLCPVCGKVLKEMDWGYGCSGYSDGCNFSIGKTICKHTFTLEEIHSLLAGESVYVGGLVSKKGSTFNANLSLDEEYNLKFDFN